jgi:hypothetical protein
MYHVHCRPFHTHDISGAISCGQVCTVTYIQPHCRVQHPPGQHAVSLLLDRSNSLYVTHHWEVSDARNVWLLMYEPKQLVAKTTRLIRRKEVAVSMLNTLLIDPEISATIPSVHSHQRIACNIPH